MLHQSQVLEKVLRYSNLCLLLSYTTMYVSWRASFLHVITLLSSLRRFPAHLSLDPIWVTDHHLCLRKADSLWQILVECACLVLNTCTLYFIVLRNMSLCTQTIARCSQVLYFWLCHSERKPHSFVYAELIKIFSCYCVDLDKNINHIPCVSTTFKSGKLSLGQNCIHCLARRFWTG